MGLPAFLRRIETDSGTLSGGSWEASLPLTNLRTQDRRQRARSADALTASTQFRIDFGTTHARWLGMLLLVDHNFTTAGQVRVVLTNSATDATARIYDSGLEDAWPAIEVHGADADGFGDDDAATWPDGRQSEAVYRHKLSSAQRVGNGGARYLFVYVEDTGNADGYVEIGRLLGGPLLIPDIGIEPNATVEWVDPSEVVRTRGGLRIAGTDTRYRMMRLRLGFLAQDEAFAFFYEWGKAGRGADLWFEMDTAPPAAIGHRRSMYCALAADIAISQPHQDFWAVDLTLEELT